MSSNQAIPIFANPGQTVTLATQIINDGYGERIDGYVPQVYNIFFPNLTQAAGYPQNMTRIDTGLYIHKLLIPTGSSSLGTFIASVTYLDPATGGEVWQVFQINVSLPFGNSSVSPL
jgi:hypothetical protein